MTKVIRKENVNHWKAEESRRWFWKRKRRKKEEDQRTWEGERRNEGKQRRHKGAVTKRLREPKRKEESYQNSQYEANLRRSIMSFEQSLNDCRNTHMKTCEIIKSLAKCRSVCKIYFEKLNKSSIFSDIESTESQVMSDKPKLNDTLSSAKKATKDQRSKKEI